MSAKLKAALVELRYLPMAPAGKLSTEIEYPSDDGAWAYESRTPTIDSMLWRRLYLKTVPIWHASGDLFIYYESKSRGSGSTRCVRYLLSCLAINLLSPYGKRVKQRISVLELTSKKSVPEYGSGAKKNLCLCVEYSSIRSNRKMIHSYKGGCHCGRYH